MIETTILMVGFTISLILFFEYNFIGVKERTEKYLEKRK